MVVSLYDLFTYGEPAWLDISLFTHFGNYSMEQVSINAPPHTETCSHSQREPTMTGIETTVPTIVRLALHHRHIPISIMMSSKRLNGGELLAYINLIVGAQDSSLKAYADTWKHIKTHVSICGHIAGTANWFLHITATMCHAHS